jgi:hypothetical protein
MFPPVAANDSSPHPGPYAGSSLLQIGDLNEITVIDTVFDGFWMKSAYRIPDTPCNCVEPDTTPAATIPINRFNVRSFITSVGDGAKVKPGRIRLKGIAFDGGKGIREVAVSTDGGKSWTPAKLGRDLGKFSFREWSLAVNLAAGTYELKVRATNNAGDTQPAEARRPATCPTSSKPFASRRPEGHDMPRLARLALIPAVAFGLATAKAGPVSYTLPEETAAFKTGPNVDVAQNNCTACHSADYISAQPRNVKSKKDFWLAEVTKMIKTYGAPRRGRRA